MTSSNEVRSASKRDAPSQSTGSADVGLVSFDVVLQASRTLSAGAGASVDATLSPSLMFEPATAERRTGARSGAEGGDRPGDRLMADRYDRTSVSSRRTQAGSRVGTASSGESGSDKLAMNRSTNARDGSLAGHATFDEVSSSKSRQTTSGDYAALRSAAKSQAQPEAPAPMTSSSTPLSATPGVARASGGAESVRAPAMLVGRLLAASQGGDADGLRSGAQSGASASETGARSNEPGGTQTSRSQNTRQTPDQGATAGRSADRLKGSAFEQLVQSIRLSNDGRTSSVRLQLNPPELGRMDVDVQVVGERVRIDVKTQSDAARLLVQERASELITSLQEQGITVERIEVGTEFSSEGLDNPGEQDTPDGAVAHGSNRFSRNSHSNSSASEDASSRPVEPDGEPVEPALRSEPAVVAESRLDIRV